MPKIVDLTGQVFSRLTVIEFAGMSMDKMQRLWVCSCGCGGTKQVSTKALRNGSIKSCGCLRKATLVTRNTTHGESKTKLYGIWCSMIGRCYNLNNKAYPRYGGRGIKVHQQWHQFDIFKKDMGSKPEGLSLDRENNDGDYSKQNCKWASYKEQNSNRRDNVIVALGGDTITLTEAARRLGVHHQSLTNRLKTSTECGVHYV